AIRGLLSKKLDTKDGTRPLEPGDIAVLFRRNEPLGEYERGLRRRLGEDVEIRREAGGNFYRRPEVVGVYRLLPFLLEYPNDGVLTQALQTPFLAEVDLHEVEASILWYGRRVGRELTDRFEQRYPELAGNYRRLRSALRTDTVPELLGRMDELLGLQEYHRV